MKYHFQRTVGCKPQQANIFFDDNKQKIVTTFGIEVELEDVIELFQAIKNKNIKIGIKVDKYEVVDVTDTTIQVSCHIIPIKDFEDLIERLGL